MGLIDNEVESLMAEAFGALPLPSWWMGVETRAGFTVWTAIERDELRPPRLTALLLLREMLEELTEGECQIHVYEKLPKRRQAKASFERFTRRW